MHIAALSGYFKVFCAIVLLTTGVGMASQAAAEPLKPIRIILVGDSTMAHKSGYGDAFCAQFGPEVTCLNNGRGGRSTKSYRVDGIWDKDVVSALQNPKAEDGRDFAKTYVLIQFGHNDGSPKPERHTDVLWEFPVNLLNYAKEVQQAGAVPILITPLTMRNFVDNKLLPDRVGPFAESTRNAAWSNHILLLDLFDESQKAVQSMGNVAANRLAGGPIPQNVLDSEASGTSVPAIFTDASQSTGNEKQAFDYTHLGPTGAAYFGKMVADILVRAAPETGPYLKK